MLEHQRGHKRYKASKTRETIYRKNAWRQEKKCGKSERKVEGRALHTAVGQSQQKHNDRCGNGSRTSGTAGWRRKKR